MRADNFDDYSEPLPGFKFIDRRKRTIRNRLRRGINSYWLVPVFILYLEFFTVLIPPVDSPLENLVKRNLYFLNGPAVVYNLVSMDFPYTLIGHFKEIVVVKKYFLGVDQVPSADISTALNNSREVQEIHRRIIESQGYHDTELGGIAAISYGDNGPKLHLYEITSVNKTFSDSLKTASGSSVEILTLLQEKENREILAKVEIDGDIITGLVDDLSSSKISDSSKKHLIQDFIRRYEAHSQLKYVLSPFDFKSFLGSARMEGEYVGIFHFHNYYMEPPSEIDVANSYNDRQIVLTLSDRGIALYDVIKGKEHLYLLDTPNTNL